MTLDLGDPDAGDLPGWEPGAHVDLMLADGLVRQYSLCGDPGQPNVWRVGVLLDPDSRGGSRYVHDNLVDGASVRVRGPRNHFALVDSPRYRFIASDDPLMFLQLGQRFLSGAIESVEVKTLG